jgi:hypothetical protein
MRPLEVYEELKDAPTIGFPVDIVTDETYRIGRPAASALQR